MTDPSVPLKTAVIVEDDPDIRHLLVEVLESAGFSTVSAGNGIDGVNAVLRYQPLITTLDVNMPGIDGFEAARRIRAGSDTYIIMLTALDDEADVVLGLSSGADEYLNKPFRPRELRARIDAMLRRPRAGAAAPAAPRQDATGPSFPTARATPGVSGFPAAAGQAVPGVQGAPGVPGAPGAPGAPGVQGAPVGAQGEPEVWRVSPADEAAPSAAVVVGSDVGPQEGGQELATTGPTGLGPHTLAHRDLYVDPESRIAKIGDRDLELTRTEFDLLAALMESKRRVRSKADLTLVLRGESYVTSYFVGDADKRAIEAHMTNLRRKLGDNPVTPRYIETVRGVGYRLTSQVAPAY
ncbi:response regulator transcription factor [Microbacterium oryzae]|uniref:response regulator transcription factor n=1 Tax=Microbacterium oryzae TaxID=743009 RepID=UPI0025B057EF|nr:response regulator transcription factor [Microbacterium oryzae]MDN3311643.1 response regulator transcription factor [Microbacterium oryzae]